eukprot:3100712-Amphidinium_carterae.1
MQHAFSLCEADADTQRRLVAYAMRRTVRHVAPMKVLVNMRNMRRAAGRLAERFQTLTSVECFKEAEEAEERELRDANEKRIAAEAGKQPFAEIDPDASPPHY